jgi:hypothetical protein
MYHHLVIDWDGHDEGVDFTSYPPSHLSKDFERQLRATPKHFNWFHTPDADIPVAIRWTGWGRGVPMRLDTFEDLRGGLLEVARDSITGVSLPLLRISDQHDQREVDQFRHMITNRLGKPGFDLPWPVWKTLQKVMAIKVPAMLTVTDAPSSQRVPLAMLERELAATYFDIRMTGFQKQ